MRRGSTLVLVIGLAVAIVLMAVASNYIAKLLGRYPWIAWIGLLIILYVALDMIYADSHRIICANYGVGCSETIWDGIMHRLGLRRLRWRRDDDKTTWKRHASSSTARLGRPASKSANGWLA